MIKTVQLFAFLPIPEMVMKREDLRDPLNFLGWRDRLWTTFQTALANRSDVKTGVFIQGLGELRWRLRGPVLMTAIHQARLSKDHGIRHRLPIPLVAQKAQCMFIDEREYHIVEQIHLYPALFAQVVKRVSSPINRPIPTSVIKNITEMFKASFKTRKQQLSKALFHRTGEIAPSFSNYFTLRFNTRDNMQKHQYSVRYMPEKNTVILETKFNSRLFRMRLTEAVSQVFAQRTVESVLWNTLQQASVENRTKIRELIETVLIALIPKYYTYSNKLDPHFFPWRYQRQLFETLSKKIGLDEVMQAIRYQFREWLESIPVGTSVSLADCSPPLGPQISRAIMKTAKTSTNFDFCPPLKTLLDYLTIAYLHDRQLMDENPTFYKIPDDHLGLRTTNKIHEGMTRLERELEYHPRHRKNDLYEVPGPLLRQLKAMGMITDKSVQMTSASMGFRIVEDNPVVKIRIIELSNALGPNERDKFGE